MSVNVYSITVHASGALVMFLLFIHVVVVAPSFVPFCLFTSLSFDPTQQINIILNITKIDSSMNSNLQSVFSGIKLKFRPT